MSSTPPSAATNLAAAVPPASPPPGTVPAAVRWYDIGAVVADIGILAVLALLTGAGKLGVQEGLLGVIGVLTVNLVYVVARLLDIQDHTRAIRTKLGIDQDPTTTDVRIDRVVVELRAKIEASTTRLEEFIKGSAGVTFVPQAETIPTGRAIHNRARTSVYAMWTFDWSPTDLKEYFHDSLHESKRRNIKVERIIAHVPLDVVRDHIRDLESMIKDRNYIVHLPPWRNSPITDAGSRIAELEAVIPRVEMIVGDVSEAMLVLPTEDKRTAGAGIITRNDQLVAYLYDILYEWMARKCSERVDHQSVDTWLKKAHTELARHPRYVLE